MEFSTVAGFFGVINTSQNGEFGIIRSSKGSNNPTQFACVNKKSETILFRHVTPYTQICTVSNHGYVCIVVIRGINDDLPSVIKVLDNKGRKLWEKFSYANPDNPVFDNCCDKLSVSFGGAAGYIESHTVCHFNVTDGQLLSVEVPPNNTAPFGMKYNDNNDLEWRN